MSTLYRASKNIIFKAIAEILSRAIYLFFFVFMARKLGSSDFGLFSFAFSLTGIFAVLIDPGLNIFYVREVSKDRSLADVYACNILTFKLLLSGLSFALLCLSLAALGYDNQTFRVAVLMGVLLIFNGFLDFFVSISNAFERMDIEAFLKVTNKLLLSVFGILALVFGCGIVGMIDWMIFSGFISLMLGYFVLRKLVSNFILLVDWHLLKKIFLNSMPMALTIVFTMIYFRIDVVMLSLFKVNNSHIGFYSASVKLIEVLNIVPAIIVGGLFPIMSSYSEKFKSEFESLFKRTYQLLLVLIIPIVIITTLFSSEIINIIYGSSYTSSVTVLSILIWTSLFIFPNFLMTNIVIITNNQKLNIVYSLTCLALNVILNLFLIPSYGIIGAGIATVATDLTLFILTSTFAVKYFHNIDHLKNWIKPLMSGIIMGIVLIALGGLHILAKVLISIVVYLAIIIATKTLSLQELAKLKRVIIKS